MNEVEAAFLQAKQELRFWVDTLARNPLDEEVWQKVQYYRWMCFEIAKKASKISE